MAAFAASILSFLAHRIQASAATQRGIASILSKTGYIPGPQIPHIVLGKEVIDKYSEVVVIGDVHGCFDELVKILELIHKGTNPDKVLKIFAGDLVNKGPKNREVIQFFLKNSHLMSVRGNHDEVVIDQYLNVVKKDVSSLRKKNEWMKELTEDEVDCLISLPFSIRIPSLHCVIVHAGVIPGKAVEDINPSDLTSMRNLVHDENGYLKATKRNNEGSPWAKIYSGPDHVYFGHDAARKLQRESFATGLDTGCVYGGSLTAVFIHGRRKGEFLEVRAARTYQAITRD